MVHTKEDGNSGLVLKITVTAKLILGGKEGGVEEAVWEEIHF